MRIYHLNFSVYDKLEIVAEQFFNATALVRAECPFESLFFLRDYLTETKWMSSGKEEIIIAPTKILETELSSEVLDEWRQAINPTLSFKVEDLHDFALSA